MELDDLRGPFKHNPFCGPMILLHVFIYLFKLEKYFKKCNCVKKTEFMYCHLLSLIKDIKWVSITSTERSRYIKFYEQYIQILEMII